MHLFDVSGEAEALGGLQEDLATHIPMDDDVICMFLYKEMMKTCLLREKHFPAGEY